MRSRPSWSTRAKSSSKAIEKLCLENKQTTTTKQIHIVEGFYPRGKHEDVFFSGV